LGKSSGCVPFSQHLQKMCLAPNWQPTTMKKEKMALKPWSKEPEQKNAGKERKACGRVFPD